MSPEVVATFDRDSRFPRVSGDEPTASLVVPQITWFSPRERG